MIRVIVTMYKFEKNVYLSQIATQIAMMCKIIPHASFQSSLENIDNTGFGFRIFGSEEIKSNLISFQ